MLFQPPKPAGARWSALCVPVLALLLTPSCLVDLADRCGENQHYAAENAICVCDSDYALAGNVCVRCGANETGSAQRRELIAGARVDGLTLSVHLKVDDHTLAHDTYSVLAGEVQNHPASDEQAELWRGT